MRNEPKRHHYIPQFILRTFSFDDNGNVFYKDIKSGKESYKQIRDVFMERDLYRDTINNDNPVQIEVDFARYENEVAPIIKEKLLNKEEFILSYEENEKLKLFFSLMSFRSKRTKEIFKEYLSRESRKFYSLWQKDKNFEDFWKRNLSKIVNCRSLKETIEREDIDEPIKVFLLRDTFGFFGKYIVVGEPKDVGEFILSDCYPVVVKGLPLGRSFEMEMYDIFVLSPKRVLLFCNIGVDSVSDILGFRDLVFGQPTEISKNTTLFRVKKLYIEEIKIINDMILKNAKEGYIYKNNFILD